MHAISRPRAEPAPPGEMLQEKGVNEVRRTGQPNAACDKVAFSLACWVKSIFVVQNLPEKRSLHGGSENSRRSPELIWQDGSACVLVWNSLFCCLNALLESSCDAPEAMMQVFRAKSVNLCRLATSRCFSLSTGPASGPLSGLRVSGVYMSTGSRNEPASLNLMCFSGRSVSATSKRPAFAVTAVGGAGLRILDLSRILAGLIP